MRSKTLVVMILAISIIALPAISLLAQEVKIGYIDSIKIFAEYKETQQAEQLYKKEVDTWKVQAGSMEQSIVKLQDELKAQSLMLSEEKQKEKKLELDKLMQEYQAFMQDTFGDDGLAARRNKELTQPIVDKINEILEKMGEEEGYSVIFDVANANIVWASKALDLTDRVLEELNITGQ
ncbi:MAG: OmpH family outer membrane protein [Candidatus Latescibacterota bacterium]